MKRFIIFALLLLVSACQSPYHIKKAEFKKNYKTVALMFFSVPEPLQNRKDEFENAAYEYVTQELVNRQYKVVGKELTLPIYKEVRLEMGGAYDAETGEYDSKKSAAIYKETLKRLKERLGVDMVLYHGINQLTANFTGDLARWHGQHESVWIQERHFVEQFVEALFITRSGQVGALSYCFTLYSTDDVRLYSSCGGLQLLAKMVFIKTKEEDKATTPHNRNGPPTNVGHIEFKSVELKNIMTDPDDLNKAMFLAIDSLVDRGAKKKKR